MIKKLIALFLLSVFQFNLFGHILYFSIEKFKIHQFIQQKIKSASYSAKDLEQLCFKSDQINHFFPKQHIEKEFSLNGKMYDIVKSEKKDGSLILYCINDKKEQQIIQNYYSIEKQKENDKSSPGQLLKHFLTMPFIMGNQALLEKNLCILGNNNHYLYLLKNSTKYTLKQIIPPQTNAFTS